MRDAVYLDPALYDAMYPDVGDQDAWCAEARAAGGPMLEVCCGNGRLLLPVRAAGIDCGGLDLAAEMLDDLRRKLAACGLAATLHQADMRDFRLARRYALVAIGFNSFLHNLTQPDQLATLRTCRAHLAPGGRLQLWVFHPKAESLLRWADGEHLVKDVPCGAGRLRIHDHADDERVEQIRHVTRRLEFVTGERVDDEKRVRFSIRYVFKPEMELLLRVAGFARWTVRALPRPGDAPPAGGETAPLREGDNLLWTAWSE